MNLQSEGKWGIMLRRRLTDHNAPSARRTGWQWGRYPIPPLPLWYVVRSVLWIAVLTWIAVMVGKQLLHTLAF